MKRVRIIPVLLLQKGGLVKSVQFKNHKYVGDPINAVKIFNEKEVDEIVILDISATAEKRPPDIQKIQEIASEAFMPVAYGGGITTIEEIEELISRGVEKVVLNFSAYNKVTLITHAALRIGSQSVVGSIDVRKNWLGKYRVYLQNGNRRTDLDPVTFAKQLQHAGAGEILLNSIENDGTFNGYDLDLVHEVSSKIHIPVVAVGGAGSVEDFSKAIENGASAVAAGSLFVFQRPHRAVLISYPTQKELREKVYSHLK